MQASDCRLRSKPSTMLARIGGSKSGIRRGVPPPTMAIRSLDFCGFAGGLLGHFEGDAELRIPDVGVYSAPPTQPPLRRISGIDAVGMLWKVRFNGVNTFRQMGSWNLLVLAFALCMSFAVAQEGQQVPKTRPAGPATPPGAAPAGPPAAGVETAQGKGSAWVKLCSKNEQTGNKQLCLVKYEGLDPNTGMRQLTVAARSVEGEDKQTLLLGVATAYTLIMPPGVQIKMDDNQPI